MVFIIGPYLLVLWAKLYHNFVPNTLCKK